MTGKKSVKKSVEKERNGKNLTEKESKQFQAMLSRLGQRKTKGFIYMAEEKSGGKVEETKDGENREALGLMFSNGMDRTTLGMNIIYNLFPNQLERIMFMIRIMNHLKRDK